jgi:conjugative relaxase-like TrwC/TraI family protein
MKLPSSAAPSQSHCSHDWHPRCASGRNAILAVLTIRRMTAGAGYKYLLSSVAASDVRADMSSPLTRYYSESGTPPGRFRGAGLVGLGMAAGQEVTEEHLYNMTVRGTHPVTGEQVGKQKPLVLAARQRKPVAGFDLTFSPQKSVSVMWALADEGTKAVIYELHREAIERTVRYAEQNAWHSRSGKAGCVQEDIEGIIATSFTHFDSRDGDPQLHDHVLVWNRAQSKSDGEWRTLDSKGIYRSVAALGLLHQGILADRLTAEFGTGWEVGFTRGGQQKIEMIGMPEDLIREFSQRRAAINTSEDQLVARFLADHGREPSPVEKRRLAQQANLVTRQDKQHRSLAELSADWRQRAAPVVGGDQIAWVSTLMDRNDLPLLRADDLSEEMLSEVAELAVVKQSERRATFSRLNLMTEVGRQLEGVRFASPEDRIAVIERATRLAVAGAVQVTPMELVHTPDRFRRADGPSRLRPEDYHVFTSADLLEAEQRLVGVARECGGPAVSFATVAKVVAQNLPTREYAMSTDQAVAVEKIATSGRRLDVLVGPAGTGKSTTMAGLQAAWEAHHGARSVVGLAPSASAAQVLGDELGIDTENTAKWLHEHRQQVARQAELDELRDRGSSSAAPLLAVEARIVRLEAELDRWSFHDGQLVIVDEASLAGTFALDELVEAANLAGAKVVLAGDTHQLGAVDAGGAFRLLVRDRDDIAPELTDVRRFRAGWEKVASVELRVGNTDALDAYEEHGRIVAGARGELLDRPYQAWRVDIEGGKSSLMVAADAGTVLELNRRARADRVVTGQVAEQGPIVADGQTAGVGDVVVTRLNKRSLSTGKGYVKNGDRWTVTATNEDGSMVVQRAGGGGVLVLPANYVRDHVELGYAVTAHRAQGRTVDTAHAMVTATTTREVLYVEGTRGRGANHLYVDTHYDPDPNTSHDGMMEPQTGREVLEAVLRNEGTERSATETQRLAWDNAESISTLAAEYLTLMRAAQEERWESLIESSGLTSEQIEEVCQSAAYGPLLHGLAQAEARGVSPEQVFPRLVTGRSLEGAQNVASVLHARLDRFVDRAGTKRGAVRDYVAGLVPQARNVADPDMARALTERAEAMETRSMELARKAMEKRPPWLNRLGIPPSNAALSQEWLRQVRVVAAYRELYGVIGVHPVEAPEKASSGEERGHQLQAQEAVARALAISRETTPFHPTPDPQPPHLTADQSRGVQL